MIPGLGGILGFFGSFIPDIIKWAKSRGDQKHERDMQEMSLKALQLKGNQQEQEWAFESSMANLRAEVEASKIESEAQIEALRQQGKPSGSKRIDAISASVRPVITYWCQVNWSIYILAYVYGLAFNPALTIIMDKAAQNPVIASYYMMCEGVIGFWFGIRGRATKGK